MPEEFAQLTASLGIVLSATELQEAVDQIDEDGNGQIEVDEYLDWWATMSSSNCMSGNKRHLRAANRIELWGRLSGF